MDMIAETNDVVFVGFTAGEAYRIEENIPTPPNTELFAICITPEVMERPDSDMLDDVPNLVGKLYAVVVRRRDYESRASVREAVRTLLLTCSLARLYVVNDDNTLEEQITRHITQPTAPTTWPTER